MFTIELAYDRPTKRTVRFAHDDWGVLYVPNDVYRQLGQPQAVRLTLSAVQEAAPRLVEAA